MDCNADFDERIKTPKRDRRSSVKELDGEVKIKRSTRKTAILQDIEESENTSITISSATPRRSSKKVDSRTPSRIGTIADAQTPRRSVRKSIKPIQEYENIIAQKGLSAKKSLCSLVDQSEENTVEGKWVPAVIGRVSTKRGKKARRAKKRQLQRQEKIAENASLDVAENVTQNQLNVDNKEFVSEHHVGEKRSNEGQINSVEPLNDESTRKDKNQIKFEEAKDEPPESEKTSTREYEDTVEEHFSDASNEGGDTVMSKMPVTADDSLEDPDKLQIVENKIKSPLPYSKLLAPNKRLDDSDCIMLSFSDTSNIEQINDDSQKTSTGGVTAITDLCDSTENNMPTLMLCSDDEDDLDDDLVTKTRPEEADQAIPPLQVEGENSNMCDLTFDAVELQKNNFESTEPETPKLRSSMTRVPTPFKSAKATIPELICETQEEMDADETPEVMMEPREIKLKSSRKRSFSFSVDRPKKCVTFHSPSNTTVAIYDGDLMNVIQEDAKNVTELRKRSLSVTETDREVVAYLKQINPNAATPSKNARMPEPTSRSKMPNFAAIHQQQFKKMESISDHVARKAERAKVLSNSITKVKPCSIQKGLPVKNSTLRECNQSLTSNNKAIPKARQRIELSAIEYKPKNDKNSSLHSGIKLPSIRKADLSSFRDFSMKLTSKMSSNTFAFNINSNSNTKPKLPKPRFDATVNTLKAEIKAKSKTSATTTNTTVASVSHIHSVLPDSRPRFNTSTAIDRHPPKAGDKLDDRRKRHLDMYKSRSTTRTGEKKNEILKGVRTNRRFELQMMCRNRPN